MPIVQEHRLIYADVESADIDLHTGWVAKLRSVGSTCRKLRRVSTAVSGVCFSFPRESLHLRLQKTERKKAEAVCVRLSQLLRCVLAVIIMMMLTMMVMVINMLMPLLSAILA